MKINGKITFLIGQESTRIELIDESSSTVFATIELTPQQLSAALSRMAYTPCSIDVTKLDRVGKKMEMSTLKFEVPADLPYEKDKRNAILKELSDQFCPAGWIADNYFDSQDSIFKQDGLNYAKTTIRRYV